MYLEFLQKLKDKKHNQYELNLFIEKLFLIARTYIEYKIGQSNEPLHNDVLSIEDTAIEIIFPLFDKLKELDQFVIIYELNNYKGDITTESQALFFIIFIITERVDKHLKKFLINYNELSEVI